LVMSNFSFIFLVLDDLFGVPGALICKFYNSCILLEIDY
jgi:hypothetical protein